MRRLGSSSFKCLGSKLKEMTLRCGGALGVLGALNIHHRLLVHTDTDKEKDNKEKQKVQEKEEKETENITRYEEER